MQLSESMIYLHPFLLHFLFLPSNSEHSLVVSAVRHSLLDTLKPHPSVLLHFFLPVIPVHVDPSVGLALGVEATGEDTGGSVNVIPPPQ